MKNTSKKTVAAFALTLTLLLGLLPSAAFAADDEEISETTEITETVVNEAPAESTATAETAPSTETVVVEIPAEVPAETNAAGGIYSRGAFLTTFAEDRYLAASPFAIWIPSSAYHTEYLPLSVTMPFPPWNVF